MNVPSVVVMTRYKWPKSKPIRYSKDNVFARDRGECQYCGLKLKRKDITLDHVIPRAQGGTTSWENIVVACDTCNQKKRDKTPHQAGMKLLSLPKAPTSMPETFKISLQYEKHFPEAWKFYLGE
jgi:5-methylcytosine-specific restriction endonuclease McrA